MDDLDAHHCVFCRDFVGRDDLIACPSCRVKLDAQPMPWDKVEEDKGADQCKK